MEAARCQPAAPVVSRAGSALWLTLAGILVIPAFLAATGGRAWLTAIAGGLSVPHEVCAFCGMTRAYLAIGRGDWGAAYVFNVAALPLYVATCVNALAALVVTFAGLSARDRR